MPEQHGPDSEQLETSEDIDRLCEIGDLIRSGEARIEDFALGQYERLFVEGYVNGDSDA